MERVCVLKKIGMSSSRCAHTPPSVKFFSELVLLHFVSFNGKGGMNVLIQILCVSVCAPTYFFIYCY